TGCIRRGRVELSCPVLPERSLPRTCAARRHGYGATRRIFIRRRRTKPRPGGGFPHVGGSGVGETGRATRGNPGRRAAPVAARVRIGSRPGVLYRTCLARA